MSTSDLTVITPRTLDDTSVISTSVAEDEYSAWDIATTYSAGESVIYQHRVYTSLAAANLAQQPDIAASWWQKIGPSNAWAMFDAETSTVTASGATTLEITLAPGKIDSIYLAGLVADSVQVVMLDADGGTEVYNQTISLTGATVPAWEGVFSTPSYDKTEVHFGGLPAYAACRVTVTITGTDVQCGTIVAGVSDILGSTRASPTAGIRDYSKKTTDDFGTTTFVRRGFSQRMDCSLLIENSRLHKVYQILAGLRATPCVWMATSSAVFEPLRFLGFYSDFNIEVAFADYSYCTLQIEGL